MLDISIEVRIKENKKGLGWESDEVFRWKGKAVFEGHERELSEGRYDLGHRDKKGQKTVKLKQLRRKSLENRLAGL